MNNVIETDETPLYTTKEVIATDSKEILLNNKQYIDHDLDMSLIDEPSMNSIDKKWQQK